MFCEACARGYMTPENLAATARWTTRRKRVENLALRNDASKVERITRQSFAAETDERRLGQLMALEGIRWTMASIILHFAFPEDYPTLTKAVLNTIEGPSTKSFNNWIRITDLCRETKRQYGVTMRELDRALWTYDYKCGSKP